MSLDVHGTGDTQQDAHRNNDNQNNDNGASGIPNSVPNNSEDQNTIPHVRGLPPKHVRKLDRFLNKNSVHGTAFSTKVKGATAPPDELFISSVDGDTTEADMAEYILDLEVHIIDLELTSHIEAKNTSVKLTVNKTDFYKHLDASL